VDFIFTHPNVAQMAVFSLPDDYYGEEAAAWLQLHAGQEATGEEIREFFRDKIAHFKIPKDIRFVEDLLLTVTGKLQKFKIKAYLSDKKCAPGSIASSTKDRMGPGEYGRNTDTVLLASYGPMDGWKDQGNRMYIFRPAWVILR
jgi:hypothetical protein